MDMSLLGLFTPSGAAVGTGIVKIVDKVGAQLGTHTGPLTDAVLAELPALFGDFPSQQDVAPSAVFVAVFGLLCLAHGYVFVRNWMNGQRFYLSFGLTCYCLFRVLGFGLRINWAQDVLRVTTGMAATVFSLVSVLYVNMMNMLLSHRIFTWRHPETGSSSWFNCFMSLIYVLVVGIIVMAIVGQAVPYTNFLSRKHFEMCKKVTRAAAVLEVFYAFAGILLIAAAFIIPPGAIDHKFMRFNTLKETLPPTHQPTWIESTGIFYFPRKRSQRRVYKNDLLAQAVRVIPSQSAPASGLTEPQHGPHNNGPKIRWAVLLVTITSVILTLSCSFRLASTFINRTRGGANGQPFAHWVFKNYIFYIFYGALEAIVNVFYLVFRVDLRFYIPDMPRGQRPEGVEEDSVDEKSQAARSSDD